MRILLGLMTFFCVSFLFSADIAVVTLAVGDKYREVVEEGIVNKRLYCQKHGYDFFCYTESLDTSRPIPWSKILCIQETLKNASYKWVFWTDADALVMNSAVPLEALIDERYNLIITEDANSLNTGHFLIRNCSWSQTFLTNVYSHVDCLYHPWWDQQAMIMEIAQKSELSHRIKIVPQRTFNSYPVEMPGLSSASLYQKGDFILHFAGIREPAGLKKLFKIYAEQVINDSSYFVDDQRLGIRTLFPYREPQVRKPRFKQPF